MAAATSGGTSRHTASFHDIKLTHAVTLGFTRCYDDERTPLDLHRGPRECRHDDARHWRCPVLPNVQLTQGPLAE